MLSWVVAALTMAVMVALGPVSAWAQGALGAVSKMQGAAQAISQGQARELALGQEVRVGDELRTGAGARLAVVFVDGSELTLGEETTLSLDSYSVDSRIRRQDARLSLKAGVFRAITGKAASGGSGFTVATPLAVIGVRGTDFWGGWLEADAVNVLLLSGTRLSIANDTSTVLITRPGYGVTVKAKDAPIAAPVKWSDEKVKKAQGTVDFR